MANETPKPERGEDRVRARNSSVPAPESPTSVRYLDREGLLKSILKGRKPSIPPPPPVQKEPSVSDKGNPADDLDMDLSELDK
jgi:hypothetical protein